MRPPSGSNTLQSTMLLRAFSTTEPNVRSESVGMGEVSPVIVTFTGGGLPASGFAGPGPQAARKSKLQQSARGLIRASTLAKASGMMLARMNRSLVLLAAASLTLACVNAPYVANRRTPPSQPSGVRHSESRVDGRGGVKILRQSWLPPGEAKSAVVLVHGLKDYSDRYLELVDALVHKGVAVYALDLRGHGDSEGARVWVDDFEDYVDDVELLVREVELKHKGHKVFLFGHSMGGTIATRLVLKDETRVDGLILSAPALKVDVGSVTQSFTRLFGSVTPTLAVLDLEDSKFSRDPQVVAAMARDPLIFDGKGPARTAAELFRTMALNEEHFRELKVPLLILHGEKDQVTSPEGSKELYGLAAASDKTLKLYPELVHDLLHEPEKAQVMGDLVGWVEAHSR